MIEVVEPGALTSVQTADGRPGWATSASPLVVRPMHGARVWRIGWSTTPMEAALLELTIRGPALRFHAATAVAITGARFDATLDGLPLPPFVGRPVHVVRCSESTLATGRVRYLAIGGGIEVPLVLGSAATDLRTGFGGHLGRALGHRRSPGVRNAVRPGAPLGGPRDGRPDSDRAGTTPRPRRPGLAGQPGLGRRSRGGPQRRATRRSPSVARCAGSAIDGAADRGDPGAPRWPADPDAGGSPGYRRLSGTGVCHPRRRWSRRRAANRRPGEVAVVSVPDARAAVLEMENELAALEVADAAPDDELGWAGALE